MIDEKKLIEKMWDKYNSFYNDAHRFGIEDTAMANRVLSDIQKMIEEQPTAYDIEEVVKQIQDIGTRFCVSVHCNDECQDCDHGSLMRVIIDVVRNGGVK